MRLMKKEMNHTNKSKSHMSFMKDTNNTNLSKSPMSFMKEMNQTIKSYGLYEKGKIKGCCSQIYNKVNCCTFCGKIIQSKISRHLLTHRDEPKGDGSPDITKTFRKKENATRNPCKRRKFKIILVTKSGDGKIINARRDKNALNLRYYLPCQYCKELRFKDNPWAHTKKCCINNFLK